VAIEHKPDLPDPPVKIGETRPSSPLAKRRPGRRPARSTPQRRRGEDKGAGEQPVEGPNKTGQSRVVDLDVGTVAALRAYRAARGLLALDLVRDSALVLSNPDGTHRHPERFSRRFAGQVVQARRALGEE
jgi:hypothetical protein